MHYVKHFDILGIDTRQITCIELQGKPTTATEGAVGLFGMNMLSADHEVYVCIAVDGAIYTWIPLKGDGGISVTEGKVNDVGELILTLSNGTTINAGVVTGKGCYVNGVPADLNFDSDPQTQIDARVKKEGDTISGILNVEGALTLPNSPDNPEKATVVDTYTSRITANSNETGLTIVDGSITTIEKIAGDTVKSANLIPFPHYSNDLMLSNYYEGFTTSRAGITYTIQHDGGIKVQGTITGNSYSYWSFCVPNYNMYKSGYYTFSASGTDDTNIRFQMRTELDGVLVYDNSISSNRSATHYFDEGEKVQRMVVVVNGGEGYVVNGVIYPMLNEGDTALPYIPYFSGLKHAHIDGIKSTGRNLFNETEFAKLSDVSIDTYEGEKCYKLVPTGVNHRIPFFAKAGDKITLSLDYANANNGSSLTIMFEDTNGKDTDWWGDFNGGVTDFRTRTKTITLTKDCAQINFRCFSIHTYKLYYFKNIRLNIDTTALPYEPYTENTYQLPETIELGKWDSFNPKTGELTRGSKTIVFDGSENWEIDKYNVESGLGTFRLPLTENAVDDKIVCPDYPTLTEPFAGFDEEGIYTNDAGKLCINTPLYLTLEDWKAYLQGRYANGNPVTAMYQKETPTIETLLNVPISYTVFDGGTETIVQGEVDNSQWGAIPKITQTYNIHENPKEAANKAYVRNGLAKKLDKTGGKITGTLIVEGGTDTALSALVVKNNDATYGLAYEGDAYKLGQGTVDEKGNFAFNAGEGLPVALRDDSETFTDGHLVVWSAEGNKFVDGGKLSEKVNYTWDERVVNVGIDKTGVYVVTYEVDEGDVSTIYTEVLDVIDTERGIVAGGFTAVHNLTSTDKMAWLFYDPSKKAITARVSGVGLNIAIRQVIRLSF